MAAEEVEDGVGVGRGSRRHDRRRWWAWSPCQSGEREWDSTFQKFQVLNHFFLFSLFHEICADFLVFFFFKKKRLLVVIFFFTLIELKIM